MKRKIITLLLVAAVIVTGFSIVTERQKNKSRSELASRIISLGNEPAPVSLDDLKLSIAAYEKRIEQHVEDAAKTAVYWKILAMRLQDRGLHGEALEALERAVYYNPGDPALHNCIGISAGILAKSQHAFPGRENTDKEKYFILAEEAFLRAIELDNRYLRPRYTLGVLYTFELERPEDAIPHLERCLEISRNDVDAMFILARAYYMLNRFKDTIELYDRIIAVTKDPQKRIDAQNNRQQILGQMNG
ncbi:MAG: tetratricopeptide repeat protein [Treponema sp.]|jgi:tetratricopeptide (TPR) repeat protein|nr:tetratricopeptide repeat protein [Treponema sp.]